MKKITLMLVLIFCMAMILSSCANTTDAPEPAPQENVGDEEQATESPDDETEINEEVNAEEEKEEDNEMLEKMQGFWLICGYDGVIDDSTRSLGLAMEFIDMTVSAYDYTEESITKRTFEFVDENTIKYDNEGEEIVYDLMFETIGGIEVMTLTGETGVINLEISSYNSMMFYYDTSNKLKNKIQGFWLVCGFEGKIDDETRSFGHALKFDDMMVNMYQNNEEYLVNVPVEFVGEKSFMCEIEGEKVFYEVVFETRESIEVMTLTSVDGVMHLEKSSYEKMQEYYGN